MTVLNPLISAAAGRDKATAEVLDLDAAGHDTKPQSLLVLAAAGGDEATDNGSDLEAAVHDTMLRPSFARLGCCRQG